MPYSSNAELPEEVKKLPSGAQTIFRKAFNSAEKQYDSEEKAFKVAWSAVKKKYEKNDDGEWVKKVMYTVNKQSDELRYTLGIVYEPDTVDLQGDFTDAEEIRKASWNYMKKMQEMSKRGAKAEETLHKIVDAIEGGEDLEIEISEFENTEVEKRLGVMHSVINPDLGRIVESYTAPVDMEINGRIVKAGTWLMGIQWQPAIYERIKEGDFTGYSMGGRGERVEVTFDEKVD